MERNYADALVRTGKFRKSGVTVSLEGLLKLKGEKMVVDVKGDYLPAHTYTPEEQLEILDTLKKSGIPLGGEIIHGSMSDYVRNLTAGRSESTCIVLGRSVPAYTPGPEETAEFLELLEKSGTVIRMNPDTAAEQQIFPPYSNEELEEILESVKEFQP